MPYNFQPIMQKEENLLLKFKSFLATQVKSEKARGKLLDRAIFFRPHFSALTSRNPYQK
jgi:hypothetical protein